MGSLSRLLRPQETVLVYRRPHWRALVRPVLVVWAGSGLAGIAGGFVEVQVSDPAERRLAWAAIAGVCAVLVLVFALSPVLRWARTVLVVTDERVIYRWAGDRRHPLDLPLARISAVRYRRTLTERLLGTGSLILECGHLPAVEIDEVPGVEAVHERVYEELHRLPPVPLEPPERTRRGGVRTWFGD